MQEFELVTHIPKEENGFTNPAFGCTKETFLQEVLPGYIRSSRGEGLPEGYIPMTTFFLWDDSLLVGLFRIRHYLTPSLAAGAGHIGYGIAEAYRGQGYASGGLALAVEKARFLVREEELFLSVNKDNPASLRVQLKNGAVVHHEDEQKIYTRIKL